MQLVSPRQALGLLTDPGGAEVTTLKQFSYSGNLTVLHTDSSVLPEARNARASWNYRMTFCDRPGQPAVVTYWMNQPQGHRAAQDFLVVVGQVTDRRPGTFPTLRPQLSTFGYGSRTLVPRPGRAETAGCHSIALSRGCRIT
jgi:predicted NAD/FAD-binding protein